MQQDKNSFLVLGKKKGINPCFKKGFNKTTTFRIGQIQQEIIFICYCGLGQRLFIGRSLNHC